MQRLFGFATAVPALFTLVLAAGCGSGGDKSSAPSGEAADQDTVATALVASADTDELRAITGLLLAIDRGYSLSAVVDAAQAGTFDARAGAIVKGDTAVEPSGEPGGFISDAPDLTNVGPIARAGFSTDQTTTEVVNVVGTFLSTPLEQLLVDVDSDGSSTAPAKPTPDPSAFDYLRTVVMLSLIDNGYSPEQIIEALIFGEKFRCEAAVTVTCVLSGSQPALTPADVFVAEEPAPDAPSESAGGEATWTGSLVYDDDTVPFKIGESEVTVVRDFDGEFSITALLTYTTTPVSGTCAFTWEKTYAGTGNLDPSGTTITFDGTETIKNSSTCPEANIVDRSMDAQRVVQVDGDTLTGVVATGSFAISGPEVN